MLTKEDIEYCRAKFAECHSELLVDALCKMALAQLESGWRPISEAPQDSDNVLLAYPGRNGYIKVGYRLGDEWFTWPNGRALSPTHFMKLPAPPSEAAK